MLEFRNSSEAREWMEEKRVSYLACLECMICDIHT